MVANTHVVRAHSGWRALNMLLIEESDHEITHFLFGSRADAVLIFNWHTDFTDVYK